MTTIPLLFSPARPSQLLSHIIQTERHPTTIIICSSKSQFLSSLVADYQKNHLTPHREPDNNDNTNDTLLSYPLYQLAIARHIRLVFVPTVSHLRAFLSIFRPADSPIPPPPPDAYTFTSTENAATATAHGKKGKRQTPLLLAYDFLGLHRDTSEWSAQGLTATAAALVEAARVSGFRAVIVQAPRHGFVDGGDGEAEADAPDEKEQRLGVSGADASAQDTCNFKRSSAPNETERSLLDEEVPILSVSVLRAGGDLDDAAWTGRKVTLGRVLGRWFRYKQGDWAHHQQQNTAHRSTVIEVSKDEVMRDTF